MELANPTASQMAAELAKASSFDAAKKSATEMSEVLEFHREWAKTFSFGVATRLVLEMLSF
jgi:hypothetical protein